MSKVRLDQRVVELGLEANRTRARARILAGDVRWGDRVLDKPGNLIPDDAELSLRARPPFVSRGGEKLAGALDHFGIDVRGASCADAGASTGGFTDCLLQRGAAHVLAIDVGYGQFALPLREDARVDLRERCNVRHFKLEPHEPQVDWLVADLSFISLRKVLEPLLALTRAGGNLLLLVKPQFELEPSAVGKGGVVREPEQRDRAVFLVREAGEAAGCAFKGEVESALAGPKGNRERFLWLQKPPKGDDSEG